MEHVENKPQINTDREADSAGVKKSTILQTGTESFAETYSDSDYLDLEEHKRESFEIAKKRNIAFDEFNKHAKLPDMKTLNAWNRLHTKPQEMINAQFSLIQKINDHPEGYTLNAQAILGHVIGAARSSLAQDSIDRQRKLAERHDFSYFHEPLMQIDEFLFSREQSIKIGGISMRDFLNNPKLTPASAYRLVLEAFLVRHEMAHTRVLEENQTPLTIAYPNFTKEAIESATGQTNAFLNTTPERFELILRKFFPQLSQLSSTEKEIIEKAREMVKRISKIKPNIYSTILNPTSAEFPPLKEVVEQYLSEEDVHTKTLAIKFLGIDTPGNIAYGYRTAEELAQDNNENSSFYKELTNSIREYVEEIPSPMNVLTKDDLPSLIGAEISLDNVDIPTLEDLRKQSMPLSQKPLRPVYSIDPQSIDWKNLVPPTETRFGFYSGGIRKFIVGLYYQNEDGESLYLPIWYDARKGEFDWGFMEAPDDPDMKDMRSAALLAAQSVLTNVQRQIYAEHQEKQKEREVRTQPQRPVQGRKIRSQETYVPREREERQGRPRPLTPIQEILQSEIPPLLQPEQQRVKNQIVLAQGDTLSKKLENLSFQDRELVIKGIEEYNERSVGQFKRLRFSGEEKEPLFTLRINTGSGGGGIRVLMHEVPSLTEESNTRSFEIVDIDYRKNIYRKRGL